jgi:hypothetical protein
MGACAARLELRATEWNQVWLRSRCGRCATANRIRSHTWFHSMNGTAVRIAVLLCEAPSERRPLRAATPLSYNGGNVTALGSRPNAHKSMYDTHT